MHTETIKKGLLLIAALAMAALGTTACGTPAPATQGVTGAPTAGAAIDLTPTPAATVTLAPTATANPTATPEAPGTIVMPAGEDGSVEVVELAEPEPVEGWGEVEGEVEVEYANNTEAFEAMINPEPLFENEGTRLRIFKTDRWDEVRDEEGNGLPGIKLAEDYPVEQLDVMLDKLRQRFIDTGAGDGTHLVISLETGELVPFDFANWQGDVNVVVDVAEEVDPSIYVHLPNEVEMKPNFVIGEQEMLYALYLTEDLTEEGKLFFYVRYPDVVVRQVFKRDYYNLNYAIFAVLGSGNASNETTETYFNKTNLRAAENKVAPLADGLKDIFLKDFAYYKEGVEDGFVPFISDN